MKKPLLIACVTVAVVTGCSGHSETVAKPSKPASAKASCAPSDDSCIPPDHLSSEPIAVPAATVGQPISLQLPTSNGTAQVQFTLTGLKTKPAGPDDRPGTRELCFGFRMKNIGSLSWQADDATAGISWKWFGLDGQQADTDPGTAGMCDELGHQFAGFDQPAPLPGKWVSGYYSFVIPATPGAIEVTDSDESPLFRLNYGPQSTRVQIDTRGR